MKIFIPPAVETRVSRRCPRCGRAAAVHGRIVRAIHDWDTTFVECLRLRCCGTTFLAAPRGLTPRARYSDRVVALTRALVGLGVPLRECARLLVAARVPATVQAIRRWCAGVTPESPSPGEPRLLATVIPVAASSAGLPMAAPAGAPGIALPLGARAWLALESPDPAHVVAALEREMPKPRPQDAHADPRCHMVVIPRGPGLPYSEALTP